MIKTKLVFATHILFLLSLCIPSLASAQSFTAPTSAPPNNNTSAPLNVGSASQEKNGSLLLDNGLGLVGGNLIVSSGYASSSQFCLNSSCITSWPSGGGSSQWTTNGSSIYYNGGNVGVNSVAPAAKLEVVTASDTSGTPSAYSSQDFTVGTGGATGGSVFISYNQTSNIGYLAALTPSIAWRNLEMQPGGGNVGIGVNPTLATLQVNGTVYSSGLLTVANGSGISLGGVTRTTWPSAVTFTPTTCSAGSAITAVSSAGVGTCTPLTCTTSTASGFARNGIVYSEGAVCTKVLTCTFNNGYPSDYVCSNGTWITTGGNCNSAPAQQC